MAGGAALVDARGPRKPIKTDIGTERKPTRWKTFIRSRLAGRILGMVDVVSLVEKPPPHTMRKRRRGHCFRPERMGWCSIATTGVSRLRACWQRCRGRQSAAVVRVTKYAMPGVVIAPTGETSEMTRGLDDTDVCQTGQAR